MAVDWTQAQFDALYHLEVRRPGQPKIGVPAHPLHGQVVTYGRVWAQQAADPDSDALTLYEQRRDRLLAAFAIVPADRILVAGAGFGFLVEVFKDAGFGNIWGLDKSAHISSNRATESRGDVVLIADDITGGGRVRNALRSATGDDEFAWIISEDVLTDYDPAGAELQSILGAAETVLTVGRPLTNIVHLVTAVDMSAGDSPLPSPLFSATLASWKARRPAHSWMDIRTGALG